ncbi:hypothetical protein [Streptomyces sp. 8N706]|uniref:hypothetical protein n=1 Tax=Streptomyces sp. 8N706 TaxID=3457416 RepID=UPI003FD2CDF9
MSHSGQGNEPQLPAVPPAYEGVVLPAHGEPWVPEQQSAPAAGQPWGEPWGPEPELPAQPAGQSVELPAAQAAEPPAAQPLPLPAEVPGDAEATQLIQPMAGDSPLPPEVQDQATQFLGRRPLPKQSAEPDAEATQLIPPVAAQAPLPPQPPVQAPEPPSRAPFGIRPGMPGDRQPPAEFDGLFRSDASPGPADSTQQMPQYEAPQQPYEPQGRASRREAERRRGLSPVALIAVVIAGCTVAGLAAGAALSGGDDGEKTAGKASQSTAAGTGDDGPETKSSPVVDPAEQQAKSLDGLLEDSNNSRSTVIKAVENTRTCTNLGQAAQDLRSAASQRNGLVTRLQKITVDKLSDHRALTTSLTEAWKASASADNHYAAWADQMSGNKGCRKGKARATGHTAAGNRASGEATQAKKEAAGLWNAIARKYGLTQRQFTQL